MNEEVSIFYDYYFECLQCSFESMSELRVNDHENDTGHTMSEVYQ